MAISLKNFEHSYLRLAFDITHRGLGALRRLPARGLSLWEACRSSPTGRSVLEFGGLLALIGTLIGVWLNYQAFSAEQEARKEDRDHRAWSLVAVARDGDLGGNRGLIQALEYLNGRRDDFRLSEIQLPNAHLFRVDLTGADLNVADLTNANLIRAELGGTNLHTANLSKARLVEANLKDAILSKAILADADLRAAELDGAHFCDTTMPDESSCNRDCTPDEMKDFGISNDHCPWLATATSPME